jgi:hypothetical protein
VLRKHPAGADISDNTCRFFPLYDIYLLNLVLLHFKPQITTGTLDNSLSQKQMANVAHIMLKAKHFLPYIKLTAN